MQLPVESADDLLHRGVGFGSGAGSKKQRSESADPDPDLHQNVTHPQHCLQSLSQSADNM
jgi:hypothetical protein